MNRPPSPALGIVSLLLAGAGAVVFPVLAVILGLVFNRGSDSFLAVGLPLILGGLSVVVSAILAIVSLVRGPAGRVVAIIALVLDVLSIPAGIVAGFFGVLFATGGGAHGRPLRVGNAARRTPTNHSDAWSKGGPSPNLDVSPALRTMLAEEWLADGSLEHASVAAFAALSLDLVALGAPPALVRRCHEAALDEVEHARDCFGLASAYAGEPLSAAAFPEARAPRALETHDARLRRVAIESVVDGSIGEATAAAIARAMTERATDPVVAEVLARIARDEQRHAELGDDIVAWCVVVGGAAVEEAVRKAIDVDRFPVVGPARIDLSFHGRASAAAWRDTRARARSVAARCYRAPGVVAR